MGGRWRWEGGDAVRVKGGKRERAERQRQTGRVENLFTIVLHKNKQTRINKVFPPKH